MIIMKFKIKYLPFFIMLMSFLFGKAAAIRDITVAFDKSYTDHVSLSEDNRDMDLMVKFIFDEDKNQLTVSLISYRLLFVFREDTRYNAVVHLNRLITDDLPYVAEAPEKSRFILSKAFRKSIPKPQKNYIFTRWINYQGLQPVPMKYKMVNDYIEQVFDITNYGTEVTVDLGYVVVMEKTPGKKHPDDYTFLAGKDLDLKYRIHIQRNPCFGQEAELELAANTLEAVRQGYSNLKTLYGNGVAPNENALKTFNEMKALLQQHFQIKGSVSNCSDLKETWDAYDNCVDSISSLQIQLKSADENGGEGKTRNIDVSFLNSMSRQIDRNVSRWLLSNDPVEKSDLVKECNDIIEEINGMIGNYAGSTSEQKKAVTLFRQAVAYFRNTCGNKGK